MTRHASGWKKAMRNVVTYLEVEAWCRGCNSRDLIHADFNVSKINVVDSGLAESHGGYEAGGGWTYDREGDWTCPECNKEGGEG